MPEACRFAARFAAFAFAIWSRNAAEDLRVDTGGSSIESTVGAVEVVDGLDRLRPSLDVLGDLIEVRDPCRTEADDKSKIDFSFLRDCVDGLSNRPLIEARAFKGRAARLLDPNLDIAMPRLSGTGVLGPIDADVEACVETLVREGRGASLGTFFVADVIDEPKAERRLDGVPWTVANGVL